MTTPDLLGDDRERWTPSRTQRRAVLAAVLVAGLVATTVAVAEDRASQRRGDAAALASVALAVTSGSDVPQEDETPSGTARLVLRNDGPQPMRVLTLRFEGRGYAGTAPGRELQRYELAPFEVPADLPCPAKGDVQPPTAVLVEVALREGRRTLRVPLAGASEEVRRAVEERCGLRRLSESVLLETTRVQQDARLTVLDVTVRNTSRRAVEIRGITLHAGLRLVSGPPLPLLLPGQPSLEVVSEQLDVVLRIVVTDCDTALAEDPDGPSPDSARLVVAEPGGAETAASDLSLSPPEPPFVIDPAINCARPGDGGG